MDPQAAASLFSVAGKVVLITGGSSGIGRMMAETFVSAGARVYITARDRVRLDSACAELGRLGEIHALPGDLATPEGLEAVVEGFKGRESRLHALVNNAGLTWGSALEKFPARAFDSVIAVNLRVPFELVQKLLPELQAAATAEDPARVINIGSVYGFSSQVMNAYSYAASKAGIHQLTRVLAAELAPRGILVNAIAPGLFPSRMTAFALKDEARHARLLAGIPLGRAGDTADAGGLALFLSSRASAYITGAVIPLDGGLLARA
ncbi:MAG: SDR family NAD(P)-dependent oxidoreductase [Betaproteobacteria bacterium]|nr:SDR family NAD(P)-dependent oxidoreductase [Betaproteobacteria bacterium]